MKLISFIKNLRLYQKLLILGIMLFQLFAYSDIQAQAQTATMRVGRFWTPITDNGFRGHTLFTSGFFPNDYNILGLRGDFEKANVGSGHIIGTVRFENPFITDPLLKIQRNVTYGLINDYLKNGKINKPITNYVRYPYSEQTIYNPNGVQVATASAFATVDPSKLTDGTFDQKIEVENEYVYGITLSRKVLGWGQNFNDNYVIFDYVFTNTSNQTYDSLYIQMDCNLNNGDYSDGRNPAAASNEAFVGTRTWQHYHGGRASDTLKTFYGGRVPGKLRVFYEYSADDPDNAGDQMGAPSISQAKLMGANSHFYTILHASEVPYDGITIQDKDDFLQPIITYTGNSNQFPQPPQDDPYSSSRNFYLLKGGLAKDNISVLSGTPFPNTLHSVNNDELGIFKWFDYPGGYRNENFMFSSFGPYKLEPGKKIHIVYASGWAGLTPQKAKEIGAKWLKGTLQDAPGLPDPVYGYLPTQFQFPTTDEIDKKKDRWISTIIDSVMLTAYRAKWNYDHKYKIPQTPPPPKNVSLYAYGDVGTEIHWSDVEAESLPTFAGYRIMRRISSTDTTFYQVIYDSDQSDKGINHVYQDKTVLALGQYYYYIQTKARIDQNDVSADPTTRGKMMYSSRVLFPNTLWVNPPRLSQDDLSKVRIAPNPYNINDPLLKAYGFTDQRAINFYNLPATCKIRIFTENGDLVQTINHDSPVKAGSETWDMITSSRQVISSGVYIAVIEKPSGEKAILKFLVVR